MNFEITIDDVKRLVNLSDSGTDALVDDKESPYTFTKLDNSRYVLRVGNRSHILSNITVNDTELEFTIDGKWQTASVKDEQMILLDKLGFKVGSKSGEGLLKAPMPGKIVSIVVETGTQVNQGDPVIILEAMKMENELKAPSSGVIKSISVGPGQSVEKNVTLLEIEAIG